MIILIRLIAIALILCLCPVAAALADDPAEPGEDAIAVSDEPTPKQEGLLVKARVELREGKWDEAEATLKKAREIAQAGRVVIRDMEGKIHLGRGTVILQQNPYAAMYDLERAVELLPDEPEAWFQLGLAHTKMKQYNHAEEAYLSCLSLDPERAGAYYNLAHIAMHKGLVTDAEAFYRRAIDLKPPYLAQAYVDLAVALVRQGNKTGGREALTKALELDPNNTQAKTYLKKLNEK